MKFMAVSQNTRDVSDLVPAETERINQLVADGTITQMWLKADYSGAFLVLDGEDEAEVRTALDSLPIKAADATRVTLTEVLGTD